MDALDTSCITVRAADIIPGDYLDTRVVGMSRGQLRRVKSAPLITDHSGRRVVELQFEAGNDRARLPVGNSVKVWRDAKLADPRPLQLRSDRPLVNLSQVQAEGLDGLAEMFPLGSVWEVGPFVEGKDPEVVRIVGKPFESGENFSVAPEDADALGKPALFVRTETIYSPYVKSARPRRGSDTRNGQPPHVLCPLTERMAEVAGIDPTTEYVPASAIKVGDFVASHRESGFHEVFCTRSNGYGHRILDLKGTYQITVGKTELIERQKPSEDVLAIRIRNLEDELAAARRANRAGKRAHQKDLDKLAQAEAKLIAVRAALTA